MLSDGSEVLKARVRVAPSEGEANAALVKLLAEILAVPRSQIRLTAGASARLKRVAVRGDPDALLKRLKARLAGS